MTKKAEEIDTDTGEVSEVDLEGFQQFDNDLDEFDAQDWDVNKTAVGEFIKIKTARGTREDPEETTRYIIVENGGKSVKIWEQAHLTEFFNTLKPGMQIVIQHTGMKPLKKGKKMRLFDVYSRESA